MKSNLSNISEEEKKDVFEQFVVSQFARVEKEERTWEKVMMIHAFAFKQCSFIIEWLEEIKKYNDDWKQKRNYCIFKATDITRWLKAGKEPVRGNPDKPDDQEEFDMDEGNKKPAVRGSRGGASSGYPTLGPPPDLGLPGEEEDKKSEQSSEEESDSDEEPEEKPKPAPVKKPTAKPSKDGEKKKDKNFYKGIEQAKKHCKNCMSNLNYSKVEASIEELEAALEILREIQ